MGVPVVGNAARLHELAEGAEKKTKEAMEQCKEEKQEQQATVRKQTLAT